MHELRKTTDKKKANVVAKGKINPLPPTMKACDVYRKPQKRKLASCTRLVPRSCAMPALSLIQVSPCIFYGFSTFHPQKTAQTRDRYELVFEAQMTGVVRGFRSKSLSEDAAQRKGKSPLHV